MDAHSLSFDNKKSESSYEQFIYNYLLQNKDQQRTIQTVSS
jgi:hypothetical protein